jgi:5-methylcytosine-specific restriction endonuclease McrA
MPKKKTSIIWDVPKEDLQLILNKSDSIVDVLKCLNLNPYNGNHKTIHARVAQDGLNLDQLIENRKKFFASRPNNQNKISDCDIFVDNSLYAKCNLKQRFLKLVKYECAECGIGDKYNCKPISLQLDHINGKNNDNRLENLRLLCPNCHSQTTTFSGKRLKKEVVKETEDQKQTRFLSMRKFNPSKEQLVKLVKTLPMTKIGKLFGVTDNSVRKRCRRLNVEWHK